VQNARRSTRFEKREPRDVSAHADQYRESQH
jgi:hypothetical protein